MFTIPQIDEIAKHATECVAKEFAEIGFKNPPVVTYGMAVAVLEAAQHSVQSDGACDCGSTEFRESIRPVSNCINCGAPRR